jgi:hypothetical protein
MDPRMWGSLDRLRGLDFRNTNTLVRLWLVVAAGLEDGHEASSWRRESRPSKIFWRPTWPLATASSRWR